MEKIKNIQQVTGASLGFIKRVIDKMTDYLGYEPEEKMIIAYVKLYCDAVARYKVVDGERKVWTDNDYIEEAIKNG
jgi:hypothetical protein